jgi:hypothetical protein
VAARGGSGDSGDPDRGGAEGRDDGWLGVDAGPGDGDDGGRIIGSDAGGVGRERLYSRQHVGQRHSTTSVPSALL